MAADVVADIGAADRAGLRCHRLRHNAIGLSFRDPGVDYSRQTPARRLLALVEALGVRPIMIAHSFGAGPAAEAAMLQPEAFAGLAVGSGMIELGRDGSGRTRSWPLGHPFLRELAISATLANPSATGPRLRGLLHRKEAATPEMLDVLNQPGRRAGTTAALADSLPSLLVQSAAGLSTWVGTRQALPLPLALLWGDHDGASPPQDWQNLAALTGAPLSILTDTGHNPQIEVSADF